MSVEFIGFIGNNPSSETTPRTGPLLDVTHIETLAKAPCHSAPRINTS